MAKGKKFNNNITARTYFCVVHQKNLENLGILTPTMADKLDGKKPEWTDEDIKNIKIGLKDTLDAKTNAWAFTICKSAEGLYHCHVVVDMKSPKHPGPIAKMLGNAHSEIMRGTKEDAEDYIEKKGKWEEKGEKVIATIRGAEEIQDNSGQRSDITKFIEKIKEPDFDFNEYIFTEGAWAKERFLKSIYNNYLHVNQDERTVQVIYIEGEAGTGKTHTAIKMAKGENGRGKYFIANLDEKNAFPFNGYQGEKTLILNELRPGIFKHGDLMAILDKYPYTVNIKGGDIPARWTKVIIATAYPLKWWYQKTGTEDTETIESLKSQFRSRIHTHLLCTIKPEYEEKVRTGEIKRDELKEDAFNPPMYENYIIKSREIKYPNCIIDEKEQKLKEFLSK